MSARPFIATAVAACLIAPVHARAGELHGQASLASQLVDRGLAITPATPVLQGAVAWTTRSGWSLGMSAGVELDSPGHLAAGVARLARSWTLSGNWSMQAGVLYYHYSDLRRANVYEPGVYWSYRDVLTFGLSAAYVVGEGGNKLHPAADVNFRWPLAGDFSISGGVGVANYALPYGYPERYYTAWYRYGQLGLLWSRGAWRVEIDRVAVDFNSGYRPYDLAAAPWLATITWSF